MTLHKKEDQKSKETTIRVVSDENKSFFNAECIDDTILESLKTPPPPLLFGPLWFAGELLIVFGDTGSGKSILCTQIAYAISNLISEVLSLEIDPVAKKVLYYDFELSPKQWELRYANYETKEVHSFGDKFIRCSINDDELPNGREYEEYFLEMLLKEIMIQEASIVVIDNITNLCDDLQKGNKAIKLMKKLKEITKIHGISILVIAHVPKRDDTLPLNLNDMSGSKNLSNNADSIVAFGKSVHGRDIRYLKQLKVRNATQMYDEDNVIVCQIKKSDNFLRLEYLENDTERNLLMDAESARLHKRRSETKKLHKEGLSYRKIADIVGVKKSTIEKDMQKINQSPELF